MAHHSMLINANNDTNNDYVSKNSSEKNQQQHQRQISGNPIFHDFLGMKPADTPVVFASRSPEVRLSEPSPAASASRGASSSGGRGPISTTSDLGSDRQVSNHLEGVPFYGPRGDISTPEIHNRILGNKRSMSDSAFMASYRDGIPHLSSESQHNLHMMKTLRNGAGGERNRRLNDDEVTIGMQPMRPNSSSLIFQPPTGSGSRLDPNATKWERSSFMNMGSAAAAQYSPHGGQFVPFLSQLPTHRFRDANVIPSNISQSAADEGSRTGIKGPGILSSSNPGSGTSERNSSILLPSCSMQKSGTNIAEHESSIPSSRRGLASASRQMTIFYGGQAHVFDDVHPNKADVIMALAGSNGGSWSTNYVTKSTGKPVNENQILPIGELDTGTATTGNTNTTFSKDNRGKLSVVAAGCSSVERISTSSGAIQGSGIVKESREREQVQVQVQAGDSTMEKKREL